MLLAGLSHVLGSRWFSMTSAGMLSSPSHSLSSSGKFDLAPVGIVEFQERGYEQAKPLEAWN